MRGGLIVSAYVCACVYARGRVGGGLGTLCLWVGWGRDQLGGKEHFSTASLEAKLKAADVVNSSKLQAAG